MRPSFPGFFVAFAMSTASLAISFSSYASAASTGNAMVQAKACKTNPHVDPSLQICTVERDGSTVYRMDTVDGTHAEFALSNSGVALQQNGPDVVRVRLTPTETESNTTISQGVSKTVYRDGLIAVDKVQNGQQPPEWVISTSLHRVQWQLRMGGCSSDRDCASGILLQPPVPSIADDAQQRHLQICNRPDCGGIDVLK